MILDSKKTFKKSAEGCKKKKKEKEEMKECNNSMKVLKVLSKAHDICQSKDNPWVQHLWESCHLPCLYQWLQAS